MVETREINENLTIGILDLEAYATQKKIDVKRVAEKEGAAHLLSVMLGKPCEITYDENRKPHFKDRADHLSVSHSHGQLAVAINSLEPTGIDIELVRDKVVHIRHKFLNPAELDLAGTDPEKLVTIWSAKEALYKLYGRKEVDFRVNLSVTDNGRDLTGAIDIRGFCRKFRLVKESLRQHILVYVTNEI